MNELKITPWRLRKLIRLARTEEDIRGCRNAWKLKLAIPPASTPPHLI